MKIASPLQFFRPFPGLVYIIVSRTRYILFSFLLASTFSNVHGQTFNWENTIPEDAGFSSEKLYAMRDTLAIHKTSSILVIRNDKIVLEWYAPGWNLSKQHGTASLAKALVGGMSLLLALSDGRMQVDDRACKFVRPRRNIFPTHQMDE